MLILQGDTDITSNLTTYNTKRYRPCALDVSHLKRKVSLKDYEQIEHQISQQSIDVKGKYL